MLRDPQFLIAFAAFTALPLAIGSGLPGYGRAKRFIPSTLALTAPPSAVFILFAALKVPHPPFPVWALSITGLAGFVGLVYWVVPGLGDFLPRAAKTYLNAVEQNVLICRSAI